MICPPVIGTAVGTLTVLDAGQAVKGFKRVLAKCVCGNSVAVPWSLWGKKLSCGCRRWVGTHNMTGSPEYRAWLSMHSRCENPKDAAYSNYGGRGIRVCERWKDFSTFFADVGPRPKGHRLDRHKVNGDYTPSNCGWVTVQESNLNRRCVIRVEWEGEMHYLKDIAALYAVPYSTAKLRAEKGLNVLGERL